MQSLYLLSSLFAVSVFLFAIFYYVSPKFKGGVDKGKLGSLSRLTAILKEGLIRGTFGSLYYPKCDFLIFLGLICNLILFHDLLYFVILEGCIFFPIPNFLRTTQIGAHLVCLAFTASFAFFDWLLIPII